MVSIRRIVIIISMIGGLGLFLLGCAPESRYKVLTFFFTGVPPFGSELNDGIGNEPQSVKKKSKKPVLPVFVHGPRASEECFYCHNTS